MEGCLRRSRGSNLIEALRPIGRFFGSLRPSSICYSTGKPIKSDYDGLLLDAGGTLLQLSKPVHETYASLGQKYRLKTSPAEIKQGFKRALAAPWPEKLRYHGDGRPFWKLVVSEATGCSDNDYFEEYYANGEAWHLPEGAYETMSLLKDAGVQLVVVSNFDTWLRKLLKDLNVIDMFDAVIVSSEVGYEKPDERIFKSALEQINVEANRAVHVGDDERADKGGSERQRYCLLGMGKRCANIFRHTRSDLGFRTLSFRFCSVTFCNISLGKFSDLEYVYICSMNNVIFFFFFVK